MPYFGVVVPRSESAVGHGPYPRALVTPRVCASRREGLRAIEINAITWRDALLDHETRFEAYILDDDEIVWSRSFGRDEKDDAEPFTKAELRKLRAEHERGQVPVVVRRGVFGMPAAEPIMTNCIAEVVFADGRATAEPVADVSFALTLNGQTKK